MQVLFVHGMGRTPLSGRRLLEVLARHGIVTTTFGYMVSLETFEAIMTRLQGRIDSVAKQGDYWLVGHSLGGVLLRAALQARMPEKPPARLVVLGSPFQPSRIARRLARNPVYRILTKDCGQLLGSAERMAKIDPAPVPVTAIVGTRPLFLTRSLFGDAPNDGVVAIDEVTHGRVADCVCIDERHTWLPSSRQVAGILVARIAEADMGRQATIAPRGED